MKTLLLILLLVFAAGAYAAPADYRVYYVKGSARKQAGSAMLRRGDSLNVQDVIHLSANSEVYLICRDFSLVQFKKPGTYTLRTAAPCPGRQSSLTASYFKYVWEELRSHHGSPESNPRHYMRNKGAVSRGDCPMVRTALYADTIYAAPGTDLQLYWQAGIEDPFISVFPDDRDRVPVNQVSIRNNKPVSLAKLISLANEQGELYWFITAKATEGCQRNYLQLLPVARYRARIKALLEPVVATTPAQTAFMKAFVLEENHFLVEALKYYAQAFRLDPTNPRIKAALKHYHEIK
ncbi:MAG: hypothetical protein EOO08_07200 [Chitinophagaceae bacterium]|nr:MAG: hypothetical protein EOO08_07200 [Chitinophagaceae bacterium]